CSGRVSYVSQPKSPAPPVERGAARHNRARRQRFFVRGPCVWITSHVEARAVLGPPPKAVSQSSAQQQSPRCLYPRGRGGGKKWKRTAATSVVGKISTRRSWWRSRRRRSPKTAETPPTAGCS